MWILQLNWLVIEEEKNQQGLSQEKIVKENGLNIKRLSSSEKFDGIKGFWCFEVLFFVGFFFLPKCLY